MKDSMNPMDRLAINSERVNKCGCIFCSLRCPVCGSTNIQTCSIEWVNKKSGLVALCHNDQRNHIVFHVARTRNEEERYKNHTEIYCRSCGKKSISSKKEHRLHDAVVLEVFKETHSIHKPKLIMFDFGHK